MVRATDQGEVTVVVGGETKQFSCDERNGAHPNRVTIRFRLVDLPVTDHLARPWLIHDHKWFPQKS